MTGLRVDKPGRKFSRMYYDTEALFVYPNESKRLTLKEVPFVPDTFSASSGGRLDADIAEHPVATMERE